jgi:hypothetical protein
MKGPYWVSVLAGKRLMDGLICHLAELFLEFCLLI